MDVPATTARTDATEAALTAVHDFIGGPRAVADGWCFEFGHHLEANWGTIYGGALAGATLAVARIATPDRVPCPPEVGLSSRAQHPQCTPVIGPSDSPQAPTRPCRRRC